MVGRGVCWNATICLCCIVLVFLCSGVKLSRYQYGRCSKRSCLMDMSISGMARRLRKEENEPIKTSINEDNCSSVGKQDKISSQDNPAGRCTTANRWSILINCYDQWDAFRNRFFLTVDENECVRDIKEQIERIHGIPSCIQQILYQGKSLADDKIKYVSYLVLLEEYKNLLNHLEKNNYVVCEEDIANSFSAFDKGFPKMVQAKGINLDKIKKEIEELQHVDRKKPLLRLGVDFPLMSNQIVDRFKELVNFYYLGDIKSVVKFSLFFFILYKYANYPPYV
ncbi:putative Ubiquitin [Plasmodium knowlesi]|uniref:Putative Ubiquitin n=1 Tax=Plasmodium knowlesi TaxID=5850 RepID=A0A1Y3DT74_PLAKN|nr:putative Ubiquitin [Plasmodium knowlesi]